MVVRLIALDKKSGFRPFGIRETWRRCFENYVLAVAGLEAKEACRIKQLCSVLKTGI